MLSLLRHHPGYLIAAIIVHLVFLVLFAVSFHWTERAINPLPTLIKIHAVAESPPADLPKPNPPPVEASPPPKPTPEPTPEPVPEAVTKPPVDTVRAQQEAQRRLEDERKKVLLEQEREKQRRKELEKKQLQVQRDEQLRNEKSFRDQILAEQKYLAQEQKRREAEQFLLQQEQKRREAEVIARKADEQQKQTIIDKYIALIDQKVRQNWYQQPSFNKKICILKIKMLPTGEVVNVAVVSSSGDPIFDRSVEHAITKSSPLPLPPIEAQLFDVFRELNFKFGSDS